MCIYVCAYVCVYECCTEVNLDWNLITDSVWFSVYGCVLYLFQRTVYVCVCMWDRWNWILYIFLLSSNRLVFMKTSISLFLSLSPSVSPASLSLAVTVAISLFLIGCCIPSFHPSMASSQWGDRIGFLLDKALPLVVVETMRCRRLLPTHTIIRPRDTLKIQLL